MSNIPQQRETKSEPAVIAGPTPATSGGGDAGTAGFVMLASPGEALSVTRLPEISKGKLGPTKWEFLGCGIDSLDLGVFVKWADHWATFCELLEARKLSAAGTDGILLTPDADILVLPGGKPPQYRWHLKYRELELYLGRSSEPQGETPNVYASISSRALWMHGIDAAVAYLQACIENLGGEVLHFLPSRCDLASDFRIPAGLDFDFLQTHRVPGNLKTFVVLEDGELETFCCGSKKSPIQLRVYNKSKEIQLKGKEWFLDVWDTEDREHVWRVEFQLRRTVLKEFGINSLADLKSKLCGLWKYLTEKWFSLRLHDNDNTSRRSFHPWWSDVAQLAERLGPNEPVKRITTRATAKEEWLVNHISGCLKTLAALRNKRELDEAIPDLAQLLEARNAPGAFAEEVRVRQIRRGIPLTPDKEVTDDASA